jgi:hypothetical protein
MISSFSDDTSVSLLAVRIERFRRSSIGQDQQLIQEILGSPGRGEGLRDSWMPGGTRPTCNVVATSNR